MSSILDPKGFLVRREPEVDRVVDVTLRLPHDEARMLAFLVDMYYDGNPAVDNEEVQHPVRGLSVAKDQIVAQLRDQGVEPLDWRLDGPDQPPDSGFRCDPEELSDVFVRLLRNEVGLNWGHMTRLNREEQDGGCCHSHDFCDANAVMWTAVETVARGQRDFDESWIPTINRAWDLAKGRLRGL